MKSSKCNCGKETGVFNDSVWKTWTVEGRRRNEAGEILRKAAELVEGPRNDDYGDVHVHYAHTAAIWSAYLRYPVTPEDVLWMMSMGKASRAKLGAYHPDNYADGAAYPALAGAVAAKEHKDGR